MRSWRKRDVYIGRGAKKFALKASIWANPFKVRHVGRNQAVDRFEEYLWNSDVLIDSLHTLSAARLVCHCRPAERCHADALIAAFRSLYPRAYVLGDDSVVPTARAALAAAEARAIAAPPAPEE